jgi:hypothetical protein
MRLRNTALLVALALAGCASSAPPPASSPQTVNVTPPAGKQSAPTEEAAEKPGDSSKADECNALIGVINKGVEALGNAHAEGDDSGAGELRRMSELMVGVGQDVNKVELTHPQLKQYAREYQSMCAEVARASRDMAAAAEAKDIKRLTDAQAALEKAVKREDPLVDSINAYCQAP